MNAPKPREWMGWCIRLDHPRGGLAGVFHFNRKNPDPHHDAIRTAVFRTKDQAQRANQDLYYKGKVVRVRVSIEEIESHEISKPAHDLRRRAEG